jgi:GNAT superfamily N-acetyltransferase
VNDSVFAEIDDLQRINDAVPQTREWMGESNDKRGSMLWVLEEGALPPVPDPVKEYFRLQSIRMAESGDLIGYFAAYHGFPEADIFWINSVTLSPDFQGFGLGPELMEGLIEILNDLGAYTRVRSYVSLKNWPSLRLCVKVGLNKMVEVAGDKVYDENAEAHMLVELDLTR